MMVRRKSEDGELLQLVIIRRPTPIDIVSATATRRVVFTTMRSSCPACSCHLATFTPFTVSHTANDSSPMNAGTRIDGNSIEASLGERITAALSVR